MVRRWFYITKPSNRMDDDLFVIFLATFYIYATLEPIINSYDFEKTILLLKLISIIFASIIILSIAFYILFKIISKLINILKIKQFKTKSSKTIKQCKTKKTAPKIIKQRITKKKPYKIIQSIKPKIKSVKIKRTEPAKRKVSINVDEYEGFFRVKYLNKDEIHYLIRKGYKSIKKQSICSKRVEKFLVKPRYNEGVEHLFLVRDIAEYLKDITDSIKLYVAVKPDIVFKMNNKTIAIEVETGKVLKSSKKQIENKVKLLNKNYKYWFFVVTDKNLVKKYKPYGDTIDKRGVSKKIKELAEKY